MLYQLPDGRVIELSTEQYFDLTDEELRSLISTNYGENIDNPFYQTLTCLLEIAGFFILKS